MNDEGFREIQLNGKQLVFLFMAATVVSVVIFLCGVLVGRGVRGTAPTVEMTSAEVGPDPGQTAPAENTLPPPPTISAPSGAPASPGDEAPGLMSYTDRLLKDTHPAENLKPTPAAPAVRPPPPPPPAPARAAGCKGAGGGCASACDPSGPSGGCSTCSSGGDACVLHRRRRILRARASPCRSPPIGIVERPTRWRSSSSPKGIRPSSWIPSREHRRRCSAFESASTRRGRMPKPFRRAFRRRNSSSLGLPGNPGSHALIPALISGILLALSFPRYGHPRSRGSRWLR